MAFRSLLLLLICTLAILGALFKYASTGDACANLLVTGRWSFDYDPFTNVQWQPFQRMLHHYDRESISKCLTNQTLWFVGDSTIRQVFWATAKKLDGDDAQRASIEAGKHKDLLYNKNNVTLQFLWDPYLNSSKATDLLEISHHGHDTAAILISTGLWHARYGGDAFVNEYSYALERAVKNISGSDVNSATTTSTKNASLISIPYIAVPPPFLNHEWLNPERASTLTDDRVSHIVSQMTLVELSSSLEVAWSAREMTRSHASTIDNNGLHVTSQAAARQAEILLNRICNNKLFFATNKASSFACVNSSNWQYTSATFGMLCISLVAYHLVLARDSNKTWACCVLLGAVFLCWLADRTTMLDKSNKLRDTRLFLVATIALVTAGTLRLKRRLTPLFLPSIKAGSEESTFLSRVQTEEWKGWMQLVILFYHYFDMSQTLAVYQLVRLLVAAYLFLTGYGHASYFLKTEDFSLRRTVSVLLRLNLLACSLCVVMGNSYDFYYFPALASFWFLVTYVTFWKYPSQTLNMMQLLARIFLSATFVMLIVRSDRVVPAIFHGLNRHVYGPKIDPYEFRFRVGLDWLAPYFGMVLSIVRHYALVDRFNIKLNYLDRLRRGRIIRHDTVLRICLGVVLLTIYLRAAKQYDDKHTYNQHHPYLSVLPILAYVMIRNANNTIQEVTAPVHVSIGTFSLELFILQYHIWLAADTKGLLRLGIIDIPQLTKGQTIVCSWTYWLEGVVITVLFFWLSKQCAEATNFLVKWFVQAQGTILLVRAAGFLVVLWIFNLLNIVKSQK